MDDDAPAQDHTHDPSTGTTHGVPHGVTLEESKGVPDSGRHATESQPIHQKGE
jgi:hypothetical protein